MKRTSLRTQSATHVFYSRLQRLQALAFALILLFTSLGLPAVAEEEEQLPQTVLTDAAIAVPQGNVYGIVQTKDLEQKQLIASLDGESQISVIYGKDANIPEGAQLVAEPIQDADPYIAQAKQDLNVKEVEFVQLFDLGIFADGVEVEPDGQVQVSFQMSERMKQDGSFRIIHFAQTPAAAQPEAEAAPAPQEQSLLSVNTVKTNSLSAPARTLSLSAAPLTLNAPALTADAVTEAEPAQAEPVSDSAEPIVEEIIPLSNDGETITFATGSFSAFGICYTVDFHYEINGEEFQFSIHGGDAITLRDVLTTLNAVSQDDLDDFMAQVTDVTFSNEELVKVVHIDEDTIAGELKESLGLVIDYSAVLTEAEIAEMNAQKLTGPDWVLISLTAFNSDEEIRIELNDENVVIIKVTDAAYNYHIRVNDIEGGTFSNNSSIKTPSTTYNGYRDTANLHSGITATPNKDYRFAMWIRDDLEPLTTLTDATVLVDGVETKIKKATLNNSTDISTEHTFIACFTPWYARLVVVDMSDPSISNGTVTWQDNEGKEWIRWIDDNNDLPKYYYNTDGVTLTASPASGYYFKGWFSGDTLISADNSYQVSKASEDIIIRPVFSSLPYDYTVMVNDSSAGYLTSLAFEGEKSTYTADAYSPSSGSYAIYRDTKANANENYTFQYWLKDDGTNPVWLGSSSTLRGGAFNFLERDTAYIAFFAPANAHIIRVNWPAEGGMPGCIGPLPTSLQTPTGYTIQYYYTSQDVTLTASAYAGYEFVGWYDGGTLVSRDQNLPVSTLTKNYNLIPVFQQDASTRAFYHVWFDASDGVYAGTTPNYTFYSRTNSSGQLDGAKTFYQEVQKNGSSQVTITLPQANDSRLGTPLRDDLHHYQLYGWYKVNANTGEERYFAPGATVTIDQDTVFYACWFPSQYNFGYDNDSLANTVSTNSFISTELYDYNTIFNMESLTLDPGRSYINADRNYEYWTLNTDSRNFVFVGGKTGAGKASNAAYRDDEHDPSGRNSSHEYNSDNDHYNGVRTTGIDLRSVLFTNDPLHGVKDVGSADHLFTYDSTTGYYYYDSSKNAAAYNQTDQRFYVYNYTVKTSATNTQNDFMPFNYGGSGAAFSEIWGDANYWFGMKSRINFFLPSAVSSETPGVNKSTKNTDMVYKFSGDDDVWVYVDDQLILDMGGIHGQVYGEINFSNGTWKVVGNGANKTNESNNTIGYSASDHYDIFEGTFTLDEGDHTLTLYYLERGASQSNCAIYFNLAPRYSLQFRKEVESGDSPAGVTFGVYTDPQCTRAANLKEYYSDLRTNEFTATGADGIKHCTGLVAGHTYYIKELVAPDGYPDVSAEVIKLTIDNDGTPHVESTADEAGDSGWKMATVTYPNRNSGDFMFYLVVKNRKTTSVTTQKTFSLLDGGDYITFDGNNIVQNAQASVTLQLQRYYLDDAAGQTVGNHAVNIVTQYFASNGKPVARDDVDTVIYQTLPYSVPDGGKISFDITTSNGAGIYSVVTTNGQMSRSLGNPTTGKPFLINGGKENMNTTGHIEVSNIQNSATIYITVIGAASDETQLAGKIQLTVAEPQCGDGTQRKITQDTVFNSQPKDIRGNLIVNEGKVTLNKDNQPTPWKHTWENLATSDGSGRPYYYYVKEVGSSTPQSSELGAVLAGEAFVKTSSSNGLSSGTITVHNTLKAIKVKLRKKDAQKHDGSDVPLEGGEFYLYTAAEYEKLQAGQSAAAVTPQTSLISSTEMGTPQGSKLITDELGRFYTGFLPMGTYYIVEEKAPDGYQRLAAPVKIVVSESGLAYDTGSGLKSRKASSDGIYNLYIDNTVGLGAINIRKDWESENTNQTLPTAHEKTGKAYTYSAYDNGADAVLLSLGAVVNGSVDSSVLNDVYANPQNYFLQTYATVVTVDGRKYIKLSKNGDDWPTLTIACLPLKRHVTVYIEENGESKRREKAVDAWYFLEEIGYYIGETLYRVADKTDQWTITYGYENNGSNGTGKVETIGGKTYNLIKAKMFATGSVPDTLTVKNSMKGGLTFTKVDALTDALLQGAEFKVIPYEAGNGNFINAGIGTNGVLTSDAQGRVTVSDLPIGGYWIQEQTAPSGYRNDGTWYYIQIGYPNSGLFEFANNEWTAIAKIPNTPIGSIAVTKKVKVNDTLSSELQSQQIRIGLFPGQNPPADDAVPTAENIKTLTLTGYETTQTLFTDLELGTYYVYELDADNHPIKDNGSLVLNGKTYTVSEAVPGVTLSTAGQTGSVEITNARESGTLTVTKLVTGSYQATNDDEFSITVKLGNKFLNAYGELVDTDPALKIKEGAGNKITFSDIPLGDYTVTEAAVTKAGYVISTTYQAGSGAQQDTPVSGQVSAGGTTDITITNNYRSAQLVIKKTIGGEVAADDLATVLSSISFTVTDVTTGIENSDRTAKQTVTISGTDLSEGVYVKTLTSIDHGIKPDHTYRVAETLTALTGYTVSSVYQVQGTGDQAVSGSASTVTLSEANPSTGEIDFTNTYTPAAANITVIKKNANADATLPLSGAIFTLTRVQDALGTALEPAAVPMESEPTISAGTTSFDNLTPGFYRLAEKTAPAGYNLTTETMILKVEVVENAVVVSQVDSIAHTMIGYDQAANTAMVKNTPGVELPATGGPGATALYLGGGMLALMALAIMLLLRRRERRA